MQLDDAKIDNLYLKSNKIREKFIKTRLFGMILNNNYMEETVKQRLISFIKYKGLNVKRFETLIGVSNGFVNNISRSIGAEKLYNISNEFPDLNTAWLLTGEGNMLNEDNAVMLPTGVTKTNR